MKPADKQKLYAQALGGRRVDTRPRTSEDVGNLRLGSFRGCNPLVWHPRSIDLVKGILSVFDFKMVVDCFPGDGAWALANLKLPQPRLYEGMTMCNLHTVILKQVTTSAIKFAMATGGHAFCDNESLQFIEGLFPDVMKQFEENDEEYFPDDDEEVLHSVQSKAEKENRP